MSRKKRSDGIAGFTLIETLIALAIVATVLGSIGSVIGTAVKGTRAIDQRLELAGIGESLVAGLPSRDVLKAGRQSGETAAHRWRIDVAPLPSSDGAETTRWMPLSINIQLQAPGGAATRITTVRLVQRPSR